LKAARGTKQCDPFKSLLKIADRAMFFNLKKNEIESIYDMARAVVEGGSKKGETIATAESCTGGMIASIITSVPGSSRVFLGGVVPYSNELKEKLLGVSRITLQAYGAVSSQVSLEMAKGLKKLTKAQYNLAVTGIAGPSGGTPEKPVGLVYIALSGPDSVELVREFQFHGDREQIRFETAREALGLLHKYLVG